VLFAAAAAQVCAVVGAVLGVFLLFI
jgi:hypothetical protein